MVPLPSPDSPSAEPAFGMVEYGQKLPLHKQRRVRRWIVPAALLFLALVLVQQLPAVWQRIQFLQAQNECLKHPVPPGVLVYSSGPPIVASARPEFPRFFNIYKAIPFSPPVWLSGEWENENLASLIQQTWGPFSATVYVGRRKATNGLERFIAVGALVTPFPGGLGTTLVFPIIDRPLGFADPATDTRIPMAGGPIRGWNCGWDAPEFRPTPEVVIYSAREDPADASHFSFVYDINTDHCVVDCWLQPDGQLKVRDTSQGWHIDTRRQKRTVLKAESPAEFHYP